MHLNLSGKPSWHSSREYELTPLISSVAFVTGAGGITGQVCTLQFAREGVRRLAGLDLSRNGLRNTESLLLKEFPDAQFLPLQGNLAIEEEVDQAFKEALRVFWHIDYAVNNAAVPGPCRPTSQNTLGDLDRVLSINLRGLWLCERAEVRLMEKQEPLLLHPQDYSVRSQSDYTSSSIADRLYSRLRARESKGSISTCPRSWV